MKKWTANEARRSETMFRRMYRDDAIREQKWRCVYCREPIRASTADHVRPLKAGGCTRRDNIKAACQPCNYAKGHMAVEAFKAILMARELPRGLSVSLMLAWSRQRIWRRVARAERHILAMVGVQA